MERRLRKSPSGSQEGEGKPAGSGATTAAPPPRPQPHPGAARAREGSPAWEHSRSPFKLAITLALHIHQSLQRGCDVA